MTSAMTAIWTTPSMTNSTALKAGSYHSIRLDQNRTGLTTVSNSQVWTAIQRSRSSRIGAGSLLRIRLGRRGTHRQGCGGRCRRLQDEHAVRRLADRDAAHDPERRHVDDGDAAQEALRHP